MGSLSAPPSHTTVRTGPYTAVREVALTRSKQTWKDERFEVGIGEPEAKGLLRARAQGPRRLLAMLRSSPEIRGAASAARRRRGVFHWR
jgi:hypothetical protein